MSRLEGPIALQVWGLTFEFAREVLAASGSPGGKQQLLPVLRCITRLGSTVAKTSALEDRKYRRDLQETFVKLLDALLLNINKIAEEGLWRRPHAQGGREEKSDSFDTLCRDKLTFEASSLLPAAWSAADEVGRGNRQVSDARQIHTFLATEIVPNLRDLLHDNDRVSTAATAIVNQVVNPALRQRKLCVSRGGSLG